MKPCRFTWPSKMKAFGISARRRNTQPRGRTIVVLESQEVFVVVVRSIACHLGINANSAARYRERTDGNHPRPHLLLRRSLRSQILRLAPTAWVIWTPGLECGCGCRPAWLQCDIFFPKTCVPQLVCHVGVYSAIDMLYVRGRTDGEHQEQAKKGRKTPIYCLLVKTRKLADAVPLPVKWSSVKDMSKIIEH